MEHLSKAATALVANAKASLSRGSRFNAPALPASTADAPRYFDRWCDAELPKLFSAVKVDDAPRAVVRALADGERSSLESRRNELAAALQPFVTDERDMVEAELAAMLGGFRSLRQSGESAEGMVVVLSGVLSVFPLWAIAKGCVKIVRREAELDPRWPPNDTEVYGAVDAIVREYRKALESAEALLAAPVEALQALPAPRPSAMDVEAKLGRPVGTGRTEKTPAPPPGGDGKHAERVAAELAARKARSFEERNPDAALMVPQPALKSQ